MVRSCSALLPPWMSSAYMQNVVAGVGIAFSAGVFVSLNLLGAGGGRPESADVIQTANAILSSVWFLSACVGGTYLNIFGPAITMCFGICTYAMYVGALWYYEVTGHAAFPLIGGAIIGVGAGAVFITSGYIQVAYSNDQNKGQFIAIQNTLQAGALVVQIPFGHILHLILDNDKWTKPRRALFGLGFVAVPLSAAWLWEIVRTRDFDRAFPPANPTDWTEARYGPAMVLFVLNWTASILWQYIVPWFIGNLDIPQDKISHYMGVQRGFLAAGEAICFGVDAAKISYVAFAGAIFAFYAVGIAVLAYMGASQLIESSPRPADSEAGEGSEIGTDHAREEKGDLSSCASERSTSISG
ncbi:hypothetical protein G7054_g2360 [Neopestalotiopsis clavispora]|nr:hypothetical protein G7054_g2360 [Neopestalotiopsis clavispora]